MSKYGPCQNRLDSCGPVVAIWQTDIHYRTFLCQLCLDSWFDGADDDPDLEPIAWGWVEGQNPTDDRIRGVLLDPHNHEQLAAILRREARIDPAWLRAFLRTEGARCGNRLVPG